MNAYISCPIPVPIEKLHVVGTKLVDDGYHPTYWKRGTEYKEDQLKEASIFVLMSENNSFDYCLDDMTLGCRKELALAKSLNKPLYMAYWKGNSQLNIYPMHLVKLEEGRVLGMSGNYIQKANKVVNNYSIF